MTANPVIAPFKTGPDRTSDLNRQQIHEKLPKTSVGIETNRD